MGWEVEDVDILRSRAHDLTKPEVSQRLIRRIELAEFDALLASPPCNANTMMFANKRGPRPMRTFEFPLGPPNPAPIRKKLVQLANKLAQVTLQAALAQVKNSPGLLVIECPEDLGAIAHGAWY